MNFSIDYKREYFWKTEFDLFNGLNAEKPQWGMWLTLDSFSLKNLADDRFRLIEITNEIQWDDLLEMRVLIEKEFGITTLQ